MKTHQMAMWRGINRHGPAPSAFIARQQIAVMRWRPAPALPAIMGETLSDLKRAAASRWDHGTAFDVLLYSGELLSRDEVNVLGGTNLLAVEHAERFVGSDAISKG